MIFRLRDYVFSPLAIKQARDRLQASQYWPPERRRAWVQEQLERTLQHAVTNVPYYRRTLGPYASRFPEMIERLDLSELPLLPKEAVRSHFQELCADDCARYKPSYTETSGSTGTPTRFMLDRASNIEHFAAIWRVLNWTGYRFGRRYADMTGYLPRNDGLAAMDYRTNCLHLSSFNFKKEHMPEYVHMLRRFQPVFVKAYPSAIELFCRWLQELGIDDYRPPAVLTCAESLLDHQRQVVTEVLACPIYDFYNQNERACLVSTCEHGTYHVHDEYSFMELVPGAEADTRAIVATTFHNRAMPLIRYQTDDLAEVGGPGAACACGRTYRSVGRIIGRVEDVVITPDGRHVGRLDAAFKYSPGIRMSQVIQDSPDAIQVRIVPAATFAQSDLDRLEHELRARLGPAIGIRYDTVEEILPGKNGKVQFMVSNLARVRRGG
jgi:phenylacetate-CoA ligase